jgi:alcohol dehydrogenase
VSHSVILTAPRHVDIIETSDLFPGAGEVLVHIYGSSVSIGSELALFNGVDVSSHLPIVLGYESIGRIVELGANVNSPSRGTRVVLTAGHRDTAVVKATDVVPIPDDIPDEAAVLLILSCDVDSAIRRTGNSCPILIAGAGALGLITLFMLRTRGAKEIDFLEPVARRRDIALSYGARIAFDTSLPESLSCTYKTCFECSDSPLAFEFLVERATHRGCIGLISDGFGGPLVMNRTFHQKELTVIACSDEPRYRQFAHQFFDAVRTEDWCAKLVGLHECRISLSELPRWYRKLSDDQVECRPIKLWVNHT